MTQPKSYGPKQAAYQAAKRERLKHCTCPHQRVSDMTGGVDHAERIATDPKCPTHGEA